MKTTTTLGNRLVAACAFVLALVAASAAQAQTFHKDIEPILQRSCQRCHNPNSVAPMSLITYEQVRPYARAIKQRTALARAPYMRGVMPPWFAAPPAAGRRTPARLRRVRP